MKNFAIKVRIFDHDFEASNQSKLHNPRNNDLPNSFHHLVELQFMVQNPDYSEIINGMQIKERLFHTHLAIWY